MAVVFSGALASGADSGWVAITPARVTLIQLDKPQTSIEFSVDGVNEILAPVQTLTVWTQPPTYRLVDYPFQFAKVVNNSMDPQTVTAISASI